jgi:hypothetical protein
MTKKLYGKRYKANIICTFCIGKGKSSTEEIHLLLFHWKLVENNNLQMSTKMLLNL